VLTSIAYLNGSYVWISSHLNRRLTNKLFKYILGLEVRTQFWGPSFFRLSVRVSVPKYWGRLKGYVLHEDINRIFHSHNKPLVI
jgi:hypothetical protein